MTITHKQVGSVVPAGATSVNFDPATNFPTALGAGDTTDLLVALVVSSVDTLVNVTNTAGGWNLIAGASSNPATGAGSVGLWWKRAAAAESTWSWASTVTTGWNVEIAQAHDSGGGIWTLDKVNKNPAGSTASNTPGATGQLSQAVEYVFAFAGQINANGGTETIAAPFTLLVPATATNRTVTGYDITTTNGSLNPLESWVTARQTVLGIASFYPAPNGMLQMF